MKTTDHSLEEDMYSVQFKIGGSDRVDSPQLHWQL